MSIYTYSAAGKGINQVGETVVVAITMQHKCDQADVAEGASVAATALRDVAARQHIESFSIIECRGSKDTISAVGIPTNLKLTE